jgi:hypothetical protein
MSIRWKDAAQNRAKLLVVLKFGAVATSISTGFSLLHSNRRNDSDVQIVRVFTFLNIR